ncbi:MAG: N-formylglutamate amidohydrolase [Treponema sp.]|nr:N-formylglutamate amidohydrolase [Treponema sp.]MBQ6056639.1 N-formylglutamate amidohydrolase [Treponema sp.]MBR0487916.1 N-formylglutamate amidohydrolase [Treponema sp.]
MHKDSIVLHIPHSSLFIPDEALNNYDKELLMKEFPLMTDRYTDELFNLPYTSIIFPFSRLFCDVERFRNDEQEEMSQKGMGVIYTKTHNNIEYRKISEEEKLNILTQYYDMHHQKFEQLVTEKLRKYNEVLIVDCHSFNPYPLPHEKDKSDRPEICIGVDDFHTDKELYKHFNICFEYKKYKTKINSPFSGSIVPLRFYGKDKRVKSIMIELNRGLYMNEKSVKNKNFENLKKDISEIFKNIFEGAPLFATPPVL